MTPKCGYSGKYWGKNEVPLENALLGFSPTQSNVIRTNSNEISTIITFSVLSFQVNCGKIVWFCAKCETTLHDDMQSESERKRDYHIPVFTEYNRKSNFAWACASTSVTVRFVHIIFSLSFALPYQSKYMRKFYENHPFSWMGSTLSLVQTSQKTSTNEMEKS